MAKIPLTIDKNYCSGWNVWHGVRELLQNAKDAEEYDEHPMTVNHYPRTDRLEITTHNVQVNTASLLVLGKSSKGDGRYRGKFGEGFVLGVLALVRAGCEVKFRNHELSWSVSFETPDPDHPLAGNELLTFTSRQLPARDPDFKVEITGISEEAWKIIKKMVLFLDEPKAAEVLKTDQGTILLHEDYKHKIYVRGLFVRSFEDLDCGYDLNFVQLDRDRQMIDEWQLHSQLGQIWNAATRTNPEELQPKVYQMAKAGAPETKHLRFYGDKKLIDSMKTQFEAEYGTSAVPVTTSVEAKEAERAGATPAMVSATLKEILDGVGLSVEAVKRKIEGTIVRRWAPADLSGGPEGDDEAYLKSCRLEMVLPNTAIVTFGGETPACHLIDDKKVIGVDRRLLDQPFRDVLAAAVNAEALRLGQAPYDTLIGLITENEEKLQRALEEKAMAEAKASECDECHRRIDDAHPSVVNKSHAESCSLYPDQS